MEKSNENEPNGRPLKKLTTLVTYDALDVIDELQRRYRRKTGKHLAAWKIVDGAIIAYAKTQGIKLGEA